MEEENVVKIYSYKKVWKVEKKIYAFQNIKLPFPINPYEALEFLAVAAAVFVAGMLIPPLEKIPAVIRMIGFPYLVKNYLMKKKLDGKNPIKYFWGCFLYFFTMKGRFLQGLREQPEKQNVIRLTWDCSMGTMRTP